MSVSNIHHTDLDTSTRIWSWTIDPSTTPDSVAIYRDGEIVTVTENSSYVVVSSDIPLWEALPWTGDETTYYRDDANASTYRYFPSGLRAQWQVADEHASYTVTVADETPTTITTATVYPSDGQRWASWQDDGYDAGMYTITVTATDQDGNDMLVLSRKQLCLAPPDPPTISVVKSGSNFVATFT